MGYANCKLNPDLLVKEMTSNPFEPSWKNLDIPANSRGAIISIGNFDGVHEGHKNLISQMKTLGKTISQPPPAVVAITFYPHPLLILKPDIKLNFLSTLEQKKKLLQEAGADFVSVLKTDDGLLDLHAEEFFEKIIFETFKARGIVEGPDFHFGKNRAGNMNLLKDLCMKRKILSTIATPFLIDDELVSSSRVRKSIQTGDMPQAKKLLGRTYSIKGKVVSGAKRGRTIGFPTANLEKIETLLPMNGVYAAFCSIGSKTHATAVNIGSNPTFSESSQKVEAHLLDFDGDLYDQDIEIHFLEKIRPVKTFTDKNSLIQQIDRDIKQTRLLALANKPGCPSVQ
ncbi:MAG: bifunctional riboflavin kinase/FAD synthetase [Planctomycetes bacterium]|nr:bifunctional riboflavin kinase/FAD synthetase [Planctomycetota bacterium]